MDSVELLLESLRSGKLCNSGRSLDFLPKLMERLHDVEELAVAGMWLVGCADVRAHAHLGVSLSVQNQTTQPHCSAGRPGG